MKMIFFVAVALILIVGCVPLQETVKGIATNPKSFVAEALETSNNVNKAAPELPYAMCIGVGYAMSFLRRWYKNTKQKQSLNTTS